jgi:siroheme synthase
MSGLVALLPTTLVADRAGIAEAAADLPGPAVVVVGEVVALPERLLDTKLYLSQRFG